MRCKYCHEPIAAKQKFCHHCGKKQQKRLSKGLIIASVIVVVALFVLGSATNFIAGLLPQLQQTSNTEPERETTPLDEQTRVELIETALTSVYTIYTNHQQGSAFLYDEHGHVITNAHVVEGSYYATVKSQAGFEFRGKIIGYSNEIDVALVHVPELAGQQPFPIEKEHAAKIGQEVIALGSPLGLENTATVGYITGTDRNFHIPPHTFTNVYQISAVLEPGNSGGPLLAVQDKKFIAINTAKLLDADHIAFSIPTYQVVDLIEDWIANPLTESELAALYYDESGKLFYDWLWSFYQDYYFDGGTFTDDESYHEWYFYDDDDFDYEYEPLWPNYDEYDWERDWNDADYEDEWDTEDDAYDWESDKDDWQIDDDTWEVDDDWEYDDDWDYDTDWELENYDWETEWTDDDPSDIQQQNEAEQKNYQS